MDIDDEFQLLERDIERAPANIRHFLHQGGLALEFFVDLREDLMQDKIEIYDKREVDHLVVMKMMNSRHRLR